MKANQFLRDDKAQVGNDMITGSLVLILLVAVTVGVVADTVQEAKDGGNITTSQKTMLGLLVLAYILVPTVFILKRIG